MIRQTDEPPVNPGDAISASLINAIMRGVNNGRMATGDGTIDVSKIGGSWGISDSRTWAADRGVMVKIQPTAQPTDAVLDPGLYWGSVYLQPQIVLNPATNSTISAPTQEPSPAAINCIVWNLDEYGYGVTGHQISSDTVTIGRIIGHTRYGFPIVGVSHTTKSFQGKITSVSGSFPAWTYTVQRLVSRNTLVTTSAQWVTNNNSLPYTAYNSAEFSGTAPYIYGNGVTITNASTGIVNSTTCAIVPIGVGVPVEVFETLDQNQAIVYYFTQMNSAQ